ncbi:MAG TPA: aminotransferase class IV [Pyrinomonadaceae bacterium]|jgi:branched-subunit amino acid aminotransferase/4-amino-4-deoxychorismate lyase|nr:aminotransferase class IV [Pyrinomonadaceae bacterium]
MHARVIHNNRLTEATKARLLLPLTAGALYGRGVFTTLAVYGRRPFMWPQHWMRLMDHAARTGVDCRSFDEPRVRASLARLIEANGVVDGRARVTFYGGADQGVWRMKGAGGRSSSSSSSGGELLIMTGDARVAAEDGLALTVSPMRASTLSPLSGIKSVNYLEHILSWEEARARDFDEAVVLNERGEIVSATMSNIFWVTDGAIHTPALMTGALAGVTRSRVIALATELGLPLVEGVYELSHLGDANEIFLTSSGLGIAIVTTFDFHRYTVPVGSVALRLQEAFRQLILDASR